MALSRRAMIAGGLATAATGALAEAPFTSMRPRARLVVKDAVDRMIRQAGLSGQVGCVVADSATGEVLEAVAPDVAQPPASVTKAFTALYALEALGADYRFKTRLLAGGIVSDGILEGHLILAGGGDPNLITDDLSALAQRLKDIGIREVTGDFLVWENALINLDEIDSTQLDYAGYNPTVTGLNLNFNRVHFEWRKAGAQYTTTMDARSENHRPDVKIAQIQIANRDTPIFEYRDGGNVDQWTVARSALGNGGSRWLPVRYPALYAGEVFATFARGLGIVLKKPREVINLPQASLLLTHESVPLDVMMRGMLLYSTNITAEAAGLSATAELTGQSRGLRTSALGMARWAEQRAGILPVFADHSGLGDASRVTAADMVRFLTATGVRKAMHPLLKDIALLDQNRRRIKDHPGEVRAKTGTLNFVSSLAGYVRTAAGQDLAFAFFAADIDARERGKRAGDEQPAGVVSWNRDAKALQQRLLQHWITRGA